MLLPPEQMDSCGLVIVHVAPPIQAVKQQSQVPSHSLLRHSSPAWLPSRQTRPPSGTSMVISRVTARCGRRALAVTGSVLDDDDFCLRLEPCWVLRIYDSPDTVDIKAVVVKLGAACASLRRMRHRSSAEEETESERREREKCEVLDVHGELTVRTVEVLELIAAVIHGQATHIPQRFLSSNRR